MNGIQKTFGDGLLMKLGEKAAMKVEAISTGSFT